ncbi:uncharacterized protein F4822DRAFT_404864 [Hypoxylon trugodes]|uniref:uncharacterized protein n=1 Tax=Hypoxylon trugodes TaxID=326681 RepID=UPI002192CE0D|nr:uncharacterized protein F4822DRAFT_404864 [Hypoxylon trugodes]KAI1389071.1 hypothetical protein F4822DRAFT_404864 [Hypoxylon trugodes]
MVALDGAQQKAAFATCVITLPICTLATGLRFVATHRSGRKPGLEDWFALAALVTFLPYAVALLYVMVSNDGRPTQEFLMAIMERDPKAMQLLEILWVNLSFFWPQQTFAKLSLLALYYRLFSVSRPFVIGVWIVAALQIAWGIGVYVAYLNSCKPISKAWDIARDGKCVDDTVFFSASDPPNSIIDFIMAGQAIWMLKSLRMGTNSKFKLAILFLIGGFSGAIGFVKVGVAQHAVNRDFRQSIFDEVQMATSLLCCCAPLYKSLIPTDIGFIQALKSWTGRIGSTNTEKPDSRAVSEPGRRPESRGFSPGRARALERNQRDRWMNIDGSALAWTDVEASHVDVYVSRAEEDRDGVSEAGSSIPLKAVRVDRTVEVV